jgi:hypothetical protein
MRTAREEPGRECGACKQIKASSEFYVNGKRGLHYKCKSCMSAVAAARYWTQKATTSPSPQHQASPQPPPKPEPPSEATAQQIEMEYRERAATTSARREAATLLGEVRTLRAKLEVAHALNGIKTATMNRAPQPEQGEAVPLILASDWHVEEEVELDKMHGLNEYDLDIARERAQRFFANAISLVEGVARDSIVKRAAVGLLGDFFSGKIHRELLETGLLGLVPAARFAKELLGSGLRLMMEALPDLEFDIYCVGGNHGRMTEKTQIATNAENSLESFVYHSLAAEIGCDRMRFHVAPGDELYAQIFPSYTVRFIHGDQVAFQGGVGGVSIPLNKWIARQNASIPAQLTCLGHWHQCLAGRDFLVNGSLIGPTPYSKRFGFSPEPPRQQFALIHSRNGGHRTMVADIWVTE